MDNAPPPEPQDVQAHLSGGIPVAEVDSALSLFSALHFDPGHAFTARSHSSSYMDFSSAVSDRASIRQILINDSGVSQQFASLQETLTTWWMSHSGRLSRLPKQRDLNLVRSEFLDSFVSTFAPLNSLDRFKLAGVIAAWWTETLPDFKTLQENGFSGVIDGWIDAIADALEDDDGVGPTFDPFNHKLVRRIMADYLSEIAVAKSEVALLKTEKKAFEESNAPEGADEDELEKWNYAKELERQARELKSEHKEALKRLAALQRRATKNRATTKDKEAEIAAQMSLDPVLRELDRIKSALEPYEQIKMKLSAARARYRQLTDAFVNELKYRTAQMNDPEKQTLVLDLVAGDIREGLDSAMNMKRETVIQFIERLWDKYRVTLTEIRNERNSRQRRTSELLAQLNYV